MNGNRGSSMLRRIVAATAAALLVLWMGLHAERLFSSQHGIIRFSLTTLFAVLILLRPKPKLQALGETSARISILAALAGAGCLVAGLILPIRLLEWVGLLLVVYACLSWALPSRFERDIPLSLIVLYWANPLPGQWFGKLQIWMQIASVEGSEWLLHIFNVRAWADGLILQTGLHVFEIPAWCSGMRTATTVFILSLALGILRRLNIVETVVFIAWSLFHALVLNVCRISAMVAFATRTHSEAGFGFLHDTAGLIVVAGVVVVYFEMLYLERRRHRIQQMRAELNPEQMEALSEYPPFWHNLNQNRGKVAIAVLLAITIAALTFRSRPYHRAMMLRDVAIALRDRGDLHTARRVAKEVSRMIPDDLDWRFTAIRMHLISGHHERVLSELEGLTDLSESYLTQKRILMAYALMSLGRLDEAAEIVGQLPEGVRSRDPRVAMILAEMALRGNDTESVALHVVTASGWAANVGRIRNLYPYLRVHRKWNAMTGSDIDIPYNNPVQALSILEAYMNLGRIPKVADITLQAVSRWPTDIRVLEPLFFMAVSREGGDWEDRFGLHLLRSIAVCRDPDLLYETFYKCFSLSRPDLAWAIYDRVHEIDPDHPTLPMAIAKYGHKWFAFRKRRLGIGAARASETLNLKPFFLFARWLPNWKPVIDRIPRGEALARLDVVPARKAALADALERFGEQERKGTLSLDMQYLHALALEMSGRIDLARHALEQLVAQNPEEGGPARVMLSEMYERKGDWINVYETLRTYLTPSKEESDPIDLKALELQWPPTNIPRASPAQIHINPLIRLVTAQLKLHLHVAALYTAQEAYRLYPYSARAIENLALAYMRMDRPEAALSLLGKPRVRNVRKLDELEAEVLYNTERYSELATFNRQSLLPQRRIPPDTVQRISPPPAELALLWHHVSIPSEARFAETATHVQRNIATAGHGLHPLLVLWHNAYTNHCRGDLADPERWIACGRDGLEIAMALNQLTLLLCREERFLEAREVARLAVTALPDIPLLWEILISLSGADTEIIAEARRVCPDSPELWLSELVARTRTSKRSIEKSHADWVNSRITEALDTNMLPGVLTSAGDYLWRGGLRTEAARIARHLSTHARGLLPAYVLAIRCALHEQDRALALASTENAIEAALQPLPEFYRHLVTIKVDDGEIDTGPDMVNALRSLRKSDPDNPLWPQMLGYIRFQRGGWEIIDALFEMNVAIAGGATNRAPYLIASEVSRLLQNYDRAADLLYQGLQHNPGNPALVNNLAFTLSQDAGRLAEAIELIPELERLALRDPRIRDTLAVVYLRAGRLDEAHQTVTTMMRKSEPASPLWFRGNMHLAEIAWRRGKTRTARIQLEGLLKSAKHIPDEDILTANALLARIMGDDAEYVNPMRAFVRGQLNGTKPRDLGERK